MRIHRLSIMLLHLSLGLAAPAPVTSWAPNKQASPAAELARRDSSSNTTTREFLTNMVSQVLDSMVSHDPSTLPLAPIYRATENSHAAAPGVMTAWRTITKVGSPSLLALDTTNHAAYFALDVAEGSDDALSILRGRVQLVDGKITELELFINRGRGDHGFSFSPSELPGNYKTLMLPPANRTKASRETLQAMSDSMFGSVPGFNITVDTGSCQFSELGWKPVDPGVWGNGSTTPLACGWVDNTPKDPNARSGLVLDQELGFIVTSGVVQGKVYPYKEISQYIPDSMASEQEAMEEWYDDMKSLGVIPLLAPIESSGDSMVVMQYYDNSLQAIQLNVYLSGPNMTSPWV